MSFFTSIQKLRTLPSGEDAATTPSAASVPWSLEFAGALRTTQHERSPAFETLISDCVSRSAQDPQPDLSPLVCACMGHGEESALRHVPMRGMNTLRLEGPFDERGWQVLAGAMPDSLDVEVLVLSKFKLDSSTAGVLFQLLGRMPALKNLSLEDVGVENAFFFKWVECPALQGLASLSVAACDTRVDVSPLLLKLLGACQLRHLSIEENGSVTAQQHADLGGALGAQERLESFRLYFAKGDDPAVAGCYAQFLRGNGSLRKLDLSGSDLCVSSCNALLAALKGTNLKTLSLRDCGLLNERGSEQLQFSPIYGMQGLRELDLSGNHLTDATIVPLLLATERNGLERLNLSENPTGPNSIAAMASLLKVTGSLTSLSCRRAADRGQAPYSDDEMEELARALEVNTSLLHFHPGNISKRSWERLAPLLERNRAFFAAAATASGLRVILGSHGYIFPNELAPLVMSHGLTLRDSLSVSSVNLAARAGRDRPRHIPT